MKNFLIDKLTAFCYDNSNVLQFAVAVMTKEFFEVGKHHALCVSAMIILHTRHSNCKSEELIILEQKVIKTSYFLISRYLPVFRLDMSPLIAYHDMLVNWLFRKE